MINMSFKTHNRRFGSNSRWSTSSPNFHMCDLVRPLNRLFIGKVRVISLLFIFAIVFVSLVKMLQPSSSNDYLNAYNLDEHLASIKDDLRYAIMIDAGSSGSRVHIYVWPPHSGDSRQLLQIRMLHDELGKDIFFKITPGLSSCASNPSSASDYIDPLLQFAHKNIPFQKHKETPLFIFATAGMRLLPQESQDAILSDLRRDIPNNYSFIFPENHVEVISGKDEGIFSWIAINFLKGRFDHTMNSGPITSIDLGNGKITTRTRTIGMLEMGGASVQIAYELTSKYQVEELRKQIKSDEALKVVTSEVNLGCSTHDSDHDYHIFVITYLGLGANVMRTTYVNSLISENIPSKVASTSLESKEVNIADPCLCVDSTENYNITRKSRNANTTSSTTYIYKLKGSGDFAACESKLKTLLNPKLEETKVCYTSNSSCPLTKLKDTNAPFDSSEFYGFSELWFSMDDILRIGGPYLYKTFSDAATQYCSTSWSVLQDRVKRKLYPNADEDRMLHQCFKSAWITTFLHNGLKMPKSYTKFQSAYTVNGEQAQWTLGALLHKTRYFPLREIEQHFGVGTNYGKVTSGKTLGMTYYVNYILFIICMLAVLACIVIYLRHLHRMVNSLSSRDNMTGVDILTHDHLTSVKVEEAPLIVNITQR